VQTIGMVPSTGASPTGLSFSAPGAARIEATRGGMAVGQRTTQPFSMLGVTWANSRAVLDGTIEVRTRSAADGSWSAWLPLESDEPDAADPGTEPAGRRGSTDPLWVGPSDGVEARVASADGTTSGLPSGLRLDLINPDVPHSAPSPSPSPSPPPRSPSRSPQTEAARSAVPPRAVPPYISRAGWRADESIVKNAPEYTDDVQVFFVHHTATTNSYSCTQSASIVRGIEMYHVRSRGWNDIGYNFLVDKCGNLFEGRAGGVTRPVLGAHTLGFNSHASAIAVIGDYNAAGVSPTVKTIIAQVATYKLGMYGNSPAGKVVLTSNGSDRYPRGTRVSLNRISGHRDTGKTECPGNALYGQLPSIRTLAAAAPALSLSSMPGALSYGGHYFTKGAIRPTWNLASPSRLVDRFEVLVDGVVKGYLRGGFRYLATSLTPGAHTVTVRAVGLNGRVSTVSVPVFADATAPVFTTAPWLSLRTGSVQSSVPIQLNWAVSDAGGLGALGLTGPVPYQFGVARTYWRAGIAPGRATRWTVRAADRAGNETRSAVTGTAALVSETTATRAGSWAEQRSPAFLGGTAAVTRTAGSTMSWTFNGSAAQLVATTGRGYGRLAVSVDGGAPVTIDPHSASTVNRRAVWAPNWRQTGSHTLTVRVLSAGGSAYARIDGLMVLR
jgi:hypothetical protein